ncbi:hypothetical protein EDC01DRAFT_626942 [Geopyxis carbonaria]|nr:hypothetical protein EDC01DRAFT_626942 [Geopyxis carbonaria]
METPPPRRYEPDELLHLAKSPLVKKPDGLPPIEEWMGPVPVTRPSATRSRTDGEVLGNGNGTDDPHRSLTSTRRPSFFESRLSRSSINIRIVPEDIVLGPPKVSFTSSSARTPSGKYDHDPLRSAGLTSPVFDDERGDSPRFDRFKFTRGEDKEKEPLRDFSDLRGNLSKRGGMRDDSEGWTSVSRQPRKSFGAEDGDRFRREVRDNGEKKGATPWDRDRPTKYENFGKEREREHRTRGKRDESSWLLDDHRSERTRDHHRDHRFGGRIEKDPEWLDSNPDSKDTKTAHSMEEFQKWKERMKANNSAHVEPKKRFEETSKPSKEPEVFEDEEEEPEAIEVPKKEDQPLKGDSDDGVPLANIDHETQPEPRAVENGVDRFFGFWQGGTVLKSPEQSDILGVTPKAPGKSRFTSFFQPEEVSPPPPMPMQQQYQPQIQQQQQQQQHPHTHQMPPQHHQLHHHQSMPKEISQTPPFIAHSPANDSNNEDREGFQRILKMLGGTNIGHSDSGSMSAPLLSRASQPSISPAASGFASPHPPPPQQNSRDPNADFLMRLMQQSQQQQQQQQVQSQQQSHMHGPPMHKYGGPSQMPPPPPIDTSSQSFGRSNNHNPISPGLDDPAVMYGRQRPSQESSPTLPRGPPMMEHHGPPPGWTPQSHLTSQAPPPQSHRQIAPPPGFARAQHQQGPPPPPPFLGGPAPPGPGPLPFQVLNGPNGPLPNIPLPHHHHPFMGMNGMNGMNGLNGLGGMNNMNGMNGGPPPPGPNMNGPPPPPGGYPLPFPPHHPDAMLGGMHGGPPFGFPHPEGLKSPPFGHGPPGKGILR